MHTEILVFAGFHGMQLPVILWLPDGEPRRILQITHGMTEHIGRYEAFAKAMTARGIAVAGYDLRGHGQNPSVPDVASFGEDGWEASLEDMHLFFEVLSARFPGVPHDMLGFSLGSFLLREYLGRWSEGVSRAIIMGTGHQPAALIKAGLALVYAKKAQKGGKGHSSMLNNLTCSGYAKKYQDNARD
jgi:alpha-beta hydrolase superfamily lysophospholipase